MKGFISELFYGNIDPQLREIRKGSQTERAMALLVKNEDLLTEKLCETEKALFLEYVDAYRIVLGCSELDSFIAGFRLGANFTYDTFINTDSPYKNLLKD